MRLAISEITSIPGHSKTPLLYQDSKYQRVRDPTTGKSSLVEGLGFRV